MLEEYPYYEYVSLVTVGTELIDVISGETVLTGVGDCLACGDSLYVWDESREVCTRYTVEYE